MGKIGLERSVCIEVAANTIVILCLRLVSCLVCGSLDEIESMSKYSSPEVSSDHHLVWIVFLLLGLLSELGARKVSLCLVMVGAELE